MFIKVSKYSCHTSVKMYLEHKIQYFLETVYMDDKTNKMAVHTSCTSQTQTVQNHFVQG